MMPARCGQASQVQVFQSERMKMKVIYEARVNQGKQRENNEDNIYINGQFLPRESASEKTFSGDNKEELQIYGVCDGLGGEAFGEEAAYIMASTLGKYQKLLLSINYHNIDKYVESCINEANNLVCEKSYMEGGVRIGTTLALVCIEREKMHICSIGDSRVYLFRKNRLTQITEDHTQAVRAYKMGIITKDEIKTHPHRNKLTQHIGISPEELEITPYKNLIRLKDSDIVLICSDGLTDMVSDGEIEHMLEQNVPLYEKANLLLNKALDNGGRDNISIVLLQIEKDKTLFDIFKKQRDKE